MTVVQSRPSRPLFFPGLEERRLFILLNDRKALLYLIRQKKRLAVPSNETTARYQGNEFEDKLREMNERGLKQLAKDARKVIMSHKFEKRRSNY